MKSRINEIPLEQRKYLYNKIKRDIIGITNLGFFDTESHWIPFMNKYFFRSGAFQKEDGSEDTYTGDVNRHLSGAALLHTLEEVDKRLQELLLDPTIPAGPEGSGYEPR